jgi:hypothetical protein
VTRRVVRVLPDLYRALEAQLPEDRGPNGEPTVAEFAGSDLLDIVDTFADLWDQLPQPIPGRSDYRELILTTRLVPHAVVRGQLSPVDGAVEIADIELDLVGLLPAPDEDDGPDT